MPFADLTTKEVNKRKKAEISHGWWKQAWTGEKKPPSGAKMSIALKKCKEGMRGGSSNAYVDALKELKDVSAKLRQEAFSLIPKTMENRRKAFLNDLNDLDDIVDSAIKKAAKVGSGTSEVYAYDLGKQIMEEIKGDSACTMLRITSNRVKVSLLDVLVQDIDANNSLTALHMLYSNATEDAAKAAAKELRTLAKKSGGLKISEIDKRAQDIFDRHAKILADVHHKVPTEVLKKLRLNAEMEATYQKALKSRRLEIAKSGASTIAAGAAIALPGTPAFAIYGFARSAAGLVQQLIEHNMKITTAAKLLEGHLATLEKAFKRGVTRAGSETGGTLLNAVLGIDLVPTLDKAKASLKDLKVNTAHAGFKAQKLTDELMKSMKALDDKHSAVEAAGHWLEKREIKKQIEKTRKEFEKLFDKIAKLNKSYNTVDRRLPRLEKILKTLGKNTAVQDFANYSVKVIVNLTAIAGGGLVDAAAVSTECDAVIKGADEISAMTIAATGYVSELKATYDNLRELAK